MKKDKAQPKKANKVLPGVEKQPKTSDELNKMLFDALQELGDGIHERLHVIMGDEREGDKETIRVYHADGFCFDVSKEECEDDGNSIGIIEGHVYSFMEESYEGFKSLTVAEALSYVKGAQHYTKPKQRQIPEETPQPVAKHTEGEMRINYFGDVNGNEVTAGNLKIGDKEIASFSPSKSKGTTSSEVRANAAELVKRWNGYEALVKENEKLKAQLAKLG